MTLYERKQQALSRIENDKKKALNDWTLWILPWRGYYLYKLYSLTYVSISELWDDLIALEEISYDTKQENKTTEVEK